MYSPIFFPSSKDLVKILILYIELSVLALMKIGQGLDIAPYK